MVNILSHNSVDSNWVLLQVKLEGSLSIQNASKTFPVSVQFVFKEMCRNSLVFVRFFRNYFILPHSSWLVSWHLINHNGNNDTYLEQRSRLCRKAYTYEYMSISCVCCLTWTFPASAGLSIWLKSLTGWYQCVFYSLIFLS